MNRHITTRRRLVGVSAAAAGLALLPHRAAVRKTAEGAAVTWRGVVLGAVGTIVVHHPDRAAAERLVARARWTRSAASTACSACTAGTRPWSR